MKIKFKFFIAVTLSAVILAGINVNASDISDKFNKLIPNIGAADLGARASAQSEWKAICLKNANDSVKRAEATKLMVEYLQKDDANGETIISLLSTLGLIGDDSVVPAIEKFLGNREIKFVDPALAGEGRKLIIDEAARALARIPGEAAAKALSSTNSIYARSGQIARAKRSSVKIENETQMPLAIPYASQEEVDQYVSNFASLSDVAKTQIVVNLGIRGDGKYADLIKESIDSKNAGLRAAAIAAVVKLKSGEIVEPLIALLLGDDATSARAATGALSTLANKDVDAKLIAFVKDERDAKRFSRISEVLTNRKSALFLPVLFERLKANTVPDRKQAITHAASIATADNASDFIDLWLASSDRKELEDVEKVIARLVNGDATLVLSKLKKRDSANQYSLLGRIGDPKTLPYFKTAIASSSQEAFVGIRNWPNAKVADNLLDIAQGKLGDYSPADQNNALRSYIRVISLPQQQLGIKITVEEQADLLIKAFSIATRNEDREFIIQRLGAVRHVKSLNFVVSKVDDAAFANAAIMSILALAHHAELRRKDADTFKAALKLVLSKTKERELVEKANAYLNTF
jgi:hypothetical protein